MNTKRFGPCLFVAFLLAVLTACGPMATAAPSPRQPAAPRSEGYSAPPSELSAGDHSPAPTAAASSAGSPLQSGSKQGGSDTNFEDYGTNPMTDAVEDTLSTFALEVDTGAYTIMRNYLDSGSLPPSDSVRVEEYVNYFHYGYPYPPEHQAFSIHIDGAPTPYGETERYQMIRIGIQGYPVTRRERKDAALVFVIDASGSMGMDNRLELVKQSLKLLVEELRPEDTVGIVVYGTKARMVLKPTHGNHQGAILKAIDSLHPEGVTNAEAGLNLGYQLAMNGFNPEGTNRVILCSDGVANTGETNVDNLSYQIQEYARSGVTLTTVGVGLDNYNDELMEQLADKGDGTYAFVDTPEAAERLFIDDLAGTLQVIALNAKVQVEFNPGVVDHYRLVGYENRAIQDEEFRDNQVDAGEIGAGHSVTALYEVKLSREAHGKIATVYLRWEDPDTHEVVEMSQDFETSRMAAGFRSASPEFQWAAVVSEYAEILRGSPYAEGSSLEDVYQEAKRISHSLEENQDAYEFVNLVRKASELQEEYGYGDH